eukprot:TRINITY_DN27540_c0_g1_i1.p1 TRINITY_DN27540_c0_g1~~TRINITY_DN27540_c0_g1_i1.p1  ORF type:complete len:881 (+),score=337.69 TRINITY_DN27540_c0_g1_i1:65-2707(+)
MDTLSVGGQPASPLTPGVQDVIRAMLAPTPPGRGKEQKKESVGGGVGAAQRKDSELTKVRGKLRVKHKLETQYQTYWWNPNQPRQDLDYVYVDRDDYDAYKACIDAELSDDGQCYVVRDIHRAAPRGAATVETGAAPDAPSDGAAAKTEKERQGCYVCLSPDHPSHRCVANPIEGSPLFMASAECTHCEQRGHVKSMCKSEGGACYGMPGIFPNGAGSVATQPMVVTVAADATRVDPLHAPSPAKGRGASQQEMKALRAAFSKPKSEFDALQEKLQFSALRQSHDDFLVLFGDRCETYKRRHQTPFYGREVPEVGFNTPVDASYRPIGEAGRRIKLRMKDLTKGLRYPPQTLREAQDKKRKADRDEQKRQLRPADGGDGVGKKPGARGRNRMMVGARGADPAAKVPSKEDEGAPVASQLKKLLELADKKSCAEATEELARRKDRAKEKRREEVREIIEARRQQRREEDKTKAKKQPFTQAMFLQRFAFPKDELKNSKHRVDMVKKGETLVSHIDSHDPVALLFPTPFLKAGENAGRKLLETSHRGSSDAASDDVDRSEDGDHPLHHGHASGHSFDGGSPHSGPARTATTSQRSSNPGRPPAHPMTPRVEAPSDAVSSPPPEVVACGGLKRPSTAPLHRAAASPAPSQPPPMSPAAQSVGGVPLARRSNAGQPPPIVNWRLKCVEDFDCTAKPPPRVYSGAYEGGGDMEVSGFNCGYWSSRFLSEQFKSQIKLQTALHRRKQNRGKVYGDAAHLATLSQAAAVKAVPWYAATPPEAAAKSRQDLWTRAIRDYSQQTIDLETKAAFYAKVLYYADMVGAPTAVPALHLLLNLREVLVCGADLTRAMLERLAASLPPQAQNDPEFDKLFTYIRSELGIEFADY